MLIDRRLQLSSGTFVGCATLQSSSGFEAGNVFFPQATCIFGKVNYIDRTVLASILHIQTLFS
jgi:hypothetical protein